jgi:hypothetical protein
MRGKDNCHQLFQLPQNLQSSHSINVHKDMLQSSKWANILLVIHPKCDKGIDQPRFSHQCLGFLCHDIDLRP